MNLSFSYTTDVAEGVRIWAKPFANGQASPGQAFAGSPLHPAPGGDATKFFTILNGGVHVDQVRLQMWTDGQTELLFETFVDVDYQFDEVVANRIFDIQFDPVSPGALLNDEDVNLSFSYTTDVAEDDRIWRSRSRTDRLHRVRRSRGLRCIRLRVVTRPSSSRS